VSPKRIVKKTKPKASPRRRAFASLHVSAGFRDFVLDQLSGVTDLRAKAMFGGLGLYAGDVFFGIVAADVLYLKVGDANRADYKRAGAAPLAPFAHRPASKSYFSVPARVLEDARTLAQWVRRSIAVARNARSDLPREGGSHKAMVVRG
jgi:DNA transformation protein and related proteins